MKNYLLLLLATSFMIGCSKEDDNLLHKIIIEQNNDGLYIYSPTKARTIYSFEITVQEGHCDFLVPISIPSERRKVNQYLEDTVAELYTLKAMQISLPCLIKIEYDPNTKLKIKIDAFAFESNEIKMTLK